MMRIYTSLSDRTITHEHCKKYLGTAEKIIEAMAAAGADLIELGIPFSDPTAEGSVIQEGNLRALSGGVTTDKVFDMVRRVRQKVKIPMDIFNGQKQLSLMGIRWRYGIKVSLIQ